MRERRAALEAAWDLAAPQLPPLPAQAPDRLYVSTDGTTVRTWEEGWKEMKIGALYTTATPTPSQRTDSWGVRAQEMSFYADFADPEGYWRGLTQAEEVVAIGMERTGYGIWWRSISLERFRWWTGITPASTSGGW